MDFLHNSLQLIEQYMLAYGYWAVFFGVMLENAGLPVPGETILLVAGYFCSSGVFRLPLVMLIATAGAILWAIVITTLGYLFGTSLPLLVKWVGRSGTILLIAIIVIGVIVWRIRRHRKSND